MKKLYFTALFAFFSIAALAIDTAAGDFRYEFHHDGSCTLVSADCEGEAVLPETVSHNGADYTLTAIGAEAFADSRATSVSLPATIATIGTDAFRRCNYLEKVSVPSVEAWLNISFANEFASPLTGYRPLYIGDTLLTRLTVPEGITTIGPYAFFNCSSLESADLGGVSALGDHAFDGCENLSEVVLPEGLLSIGNWAFSICCSLSEITVPASTVSLGQGTFYGCSSLADIKLPTGLKVIPALCFAGCISLDTLDFLPDTVSGIGDHAFYFCTGLRTADFPESVYLLGDYVFQDCESLERVSVPRQGVAPGRFMFASCRNLTDVRLPDGITSVPQGLFLECESLQSVDVPSTVTDIEDYAFAGCNSLRYIAFPAGLRHIGDRSMYACGSLSRIEFPISMESVGAEAFYQCYGLREIHVRSVEPFSISFFSFDWKADREAQVYVPASSLELYRSDTYGWANFDNLTGLAEYNPDTVLEILWGHASVSRPVAYGSCVRLQVKGTDGSLPEQVSFNGMPLDISSDGTVETPEITGPSTLEILSN